MLSLTCVPSRSLLVAGKGHDLDLLFTFHAPPPPRTAQRRPICVVPAVDVSGSMGGPKLAGVRLALTRLAQHLVPGDFLGLVTFDSAARVAMAPAELTEKRRAEFLATTARLHAGSNTNLAGGLLEALGQLQARTVPLGLRPRVLLLTDGRANAGPAQSPDDLRGMVKERFNEIALSAYGYGEDCDQALLGDLAEAGGGSYAFIDSEDAVLTAFARELGGLLATHASDVRVRVVPLAGVPVEERLGDVLHGGSVSTVARVPVPARAGGALEVARVEARWRDVSGVERTEVLNPEVRFVSEADADTTDRPDVSRARDERVLREAQERAEELSRGLDFGGAQAAVLAALRNLRDEKLIAFARENILPAYEDKEMYSSSSKKRMSSYSALKHKRQLLADLAVAQEFGVGASDAEREMEESFKADPAGRKDKKPR